MKNTMKCVAAAAMLAVTAGSAQAQTVQYSTQYSFSGLAGSFGALATNMFGSVASGVTLIFTGQPVTTVTAPSFIDFGTVSYVATGSGFNFTGQSIFMQIVQTLPTGGSAVIGGAVAGNISSNSSSNAIINWNQPSRFASIGPATYEVERLSSGQTSINAFNSGPQTIRGFVTATPEPASMMLLGTGLLGLFGVARRKKAKLDV